MMRPLLRFIVRGWLARLGRTLLAIGGVALGVAVLLAVRTANHSAIEAFGRTLEMVAGKADIEIFAEGDGRFDGGLLPRFRRMQGVQSAAPVYSLPGLAGEQERGVRLLGVDMARDSEMRPWYSADLMDPTDDLAPFTHPRAAMMTEALAAELGLARGDRFPFRHTNRIDTLTLIGLLKGEEISLAQTRDLLVMDLPRAWELEDDQLLLNRIDILLRPGYEAEDAIDAVRTLLPEGLRAEVAGWRRPQAKKMLASFHLNLTALAFVALMVSGFLVFQTVSTTALERRRNAGVLRSIGAGKRFIRQMFLLEGIGLGFLGSLVGIPLGLLLARSAVKAVSRTVQSVYLLETTSELFVTWDTLITSALLGFAVSMLSVWPLALEASRVPPRESLSRQVLEDRLRPRLLAAAGGGFLLLATVITQWPLAAYPVQSGYFASACYILGTALATPWLLGVIHSLFLWLGGSKRSAAVRLGMGVLIRSRHRVTPAIAALATAVAMWLSVDMMVRSFRGTVDTWVRGTITADLVVTSEGGMALRKEELLPLALFSRLQTAPGIADVDHFRSERVPIDGLPTAVAMVDMASVDRQDRLHYKAKLRGEPPTRPIVRGEQACLITEPLAFRANLQPGDTIRFPTPSGEAALQITGVFYDYTSDAGMVLVDRRWFVERWKDDRIESIAVYLPEGATLAEGRAAVVAALPEDAEVEIFTNNELRETVLKVFDNTFAITYALEMVAIMVALLAVGGGMASLVAERQRELAILRAVGASRRQLMKRILFESGLIGGVGWGFGAALGVVLSYVLTFVVNRYSFGWTLALEYPFGQIAFSGVLMITAALAAGAIPALHAARIQVAQGVRVDSE